MSPAFTAVVVDHHRVGLPSRRRRDVDHAPPTALDHGGDQTAREPNRGHQVQIECGLPVFVSEVLEAGGSRRTAHVVHQDVDAPGLGEDHIAHLGRTLWRREIRCDDYRATPLGLDRLCRLEKWIAATRADRDVGTFPRELDGDRASDAVSRASHQSELPLQSQFHDT